jgi:hypothetical protein
MRSKTKWSLVLTVGLLAVGLSFGYPGYRTDTSAGTCPYLGHASTDQDKDGPEARGPVGVCPFSGARSEQDEQPGIADPHDRTTPRGKCPFSGADEDAGRDHPAVTPDEARRRV